LSAVGVPVRSSGQQANPFRRSAGSRIEGVLVFKYFVHADFPARDPRADNMQTLIQPPACVRQCSVKSGQLRLTLSVWLNPSARSISVHER
jgi:hypothetical protein